MLKHERQMRISEILSESNLLVVSQLSERLGVSEATIRRDLADLEERGFLTRTHGGAIPVKEASPEPPVMQRIKEQANAKARIGQMAASMIKAGETVFIGSGTTTLEVARHLAGRQDITVITNALTVVNILAQESGISVISTGGMLRQSELSFIGYLTEQVLQELRPQKAFIGIRAISLAHGLTNDYIPEISTDRIIFQSASEIVVVADHSKFERVSTAFVAPVFAVHHVVTDSETPRDVCEQLREGGVNVLVC
jgi:DeoR/GlpR family transcriptional regulator of sugar metabolism